MTGWVAACSNVPCASAVQQLFAVASSQSLCFEQLFGCGDERRVVDALVNAFCTTTNVAAALRLSSMRAERVDGHGAVLTHVLKRPERVLAAAQVRQQSPRQPECCDKPI